jgi:predicted lactoylglutathione lyase
MSRDILPDQRVTLLTLGVRDLDRAKAFYAALGWHPARATEDMAAYQLRGMAFALYSLHGMARDQGRDEAGLGTGAAVLSQNFPDEDEVDRAWARAMKAGARALRAPQSVSWGGYAGLFADPDGHVWELAHNPFWPLGPDGALTLPAD